MSALGAVPPAEAAGGPRGERGAREPLFRPLSAEDGEQLPAEIESLCMNCFQNVRGRRGLRGGGPGTGLDRTGPAGGAGLVGVSGGRGPARGRRRSPGPEEPVPSIALAAVQGVTRLLLTRIPFFKEIIVSSFSCDSCCWSNTEIQSAGRVQEQGVRYRLAVTCRQVSQLCPVRGSAPTACSSNQLFVFGAT